MFLHYSTKFKWYYIDEILNDFCNENQIIYYNKVHYYNIPCAFDIEVSSFYVDEDIKASCMYVWQLGINGACIYGRTWKTCLYCLERISEKLGLNKRRRLIIYVHNLAYEFQFIRKRIEWEKVFILKGRKIGYALSTTGIEFRCSYILSGYSLEYIGNNLLFKYPVKKQVGLLDYNKIRHSKTPLTEEELKYCIYDVKVVMSYIQEKIEQDGNIGKIPLTKTGYTRNLCRNNCLYVNKSHRREVKKYLTYRQIMNELTLTVDEYKVLKYSAQGGFTHASANHATKILNNVGSIDFTSAYPYTMVAEYFPMSKGCYVDNISEMQFKYFLEKKCFIFTVVLYDVHPIIGYEHYISFSKCRNVENYILDNGRIVSAKRLTTTITELDYKIIRMVYDWDKMQILSGYVYDRGYLPKDFILSILELYETKTKLKGVEGKEIEYLVGKENLNSTFGMIYTDILQDNINYLNDEYTVIPADPEKSINKYNTSAKRFLFYPWAIYVTAHCRFNLWSGILSFKDDYVYSDTDSIKCLNIENHMEYIRLYNKLVEKKLQEVCATYNIPIEKTRPKTNKGVEKVLGLWDIEESYDKFKTLGAKRYMYEQDGKVNITISGVNKKLAMPYLTKKYGNDIFEKFTEGFYVPPGYSGKITLTYIDDETQGEVIDYRGVKANYHELSSIHMENGSYELGMKGYLKYLKGITEVEE